MEQLKTLLEIVLALGISGTIFVTVLWIVIADVLFNIIQTIRSIFTNSLIVKLLAK